MSIDRLATRPLVAVAAAVLLALALATPRVHAQKEVGAMGKGIVGLGLLSGELVLSVEALAGVKNPWALAIPTIVAMGGGAVGGYFIDKLDKPEASVALLACGMALFLPSIVIAVAKTKYVSEKDLAEDVSVTVADEEEEEEAGEEGTETEAEAATEAKAPGAIHAMVDVSRSQVQIGVPPLEVHGLYSDEELHFLARDQGVEYRLSLLHVAF
ncbi:MAG: hypothetical protein JRG91_05535 [Deltaproteobacteria bacterium]|nr:hypothetical protein [Deltaproteobacteria bacterium]